MIMGGTYGGCYLLTITSLTSISPTCNKRNVALISEWINSQLGVPPSRGYIRFVEPETANFAFGGYTCLDLLEREKATARPGSAAAQTSSRPGTAATLTNSMRGSTKHKRSILGRHKSSSTDENQPLSTKNENISLMETKVGVKRGRSMFGLFGKSKIAAA